MGALTVRPAIVDDVDAIFALHCDVHALHAQAMPELFKPPGPELLTREKLAHWLAMPERHVLVAELDGEVVGYVMADVQRRKESVYQHASEVLYIHQIDVRQDRRGQGGATALLNAVQSLPETRDVARVELDVWSFNERALRAFEKVGFHPFNVRLCRIRSTQT